MDVFVYMDDKEGGFEYTFTSMSQYLNDHVKQSSCDFVSMNAIHKQNEIFDSPLIQLNIIGSRGVTEVTGNESS